LIVPSGSWLTPIVLSATVFPVDRLRIWIPYPRLPSIVLPMTVLASDAIDASSALPIAIPSPLLPTWTTPEIVLLVENAVVPMRLS